MSRKKEVTGALFFWPNEPHVTGYLTIGDAYFELAGVRRSNIRTDFKGRQTNEEEEPQADMFDGQSGESGERKCDLA
jgi:hypothetical protein